MMDSRREPRFIRPSLWNPLSSGPRDQMTFVVSAELVAVEVGVADAGKLFRVAAREIRITLDDFRNFTAAPFGFRIPKMMRSRDGLRCSSTT